MNCIESIRKDSVQEITWKKLLRANRTIEGPFQINVAELSSPVVCEHVLRVLPGKRLVVMGTWEDKPVVAKIFYEPGRAKKHYKKELSGNEDLVHHRIPTPTVLAHGTAFKKRAYVILFEQILEAKSLGDIWEQKCHPQELLSLMQAFTIELATHHVMGIMQNDLHLKNFLVQGNRILTLDGGSISVSDEPLDKKASLDNLALFFAQLGVGTEKLQDELFQLYAKSRGWLVKPADIQFLQQSLKNWLNTRWRRYETKIARSSSAFGRIVSPQTLTMYDRKYKTPALYKLLANPEAVMQLPETRMLKAGRSSTVVEFALDDKIFVMKRYNIKNTWHRLRRCLISTRAANSWRLAHLLLLFGIPTAKPVAFIEKRFFGLRGKSYFIMEKVPGENLIDFFANYSSDDPHEPHYVKVAVRVATLLKNLAKLLLSHGDLKATNILVQDERPVLIDLDGMIEHHSQGEMRRAYRREIRRFMRNWENQPSAQCLFEKLLDE